MSTKIGNLDLVGVRFGSDEVTAIYAGTDLVYSSYNYKEKYLTLVPTTASSTFQFSQTGLSYSLDSGSTWTALEASTNTPSVGVGDKIMFKGTITPTSYGIGKFSSSSEFDAEGNAMSLLYGDNFIGETSLSGKSYAFHYLFYQSSIVSAKNLVLPATTLAEGCYYGMFDSCSSLTVAPKLPATTLANYCYNGMFGFCTSLTTAPQLPSTTLANYCYSNMFFSCRSLTVAPQLPATTLAEGCYRQMFESCTSLQTAPQLLALTLVNYCYQDMFRSSSSLNSITCLANDISASNCTTNWVNGVAASGTFTKANEMSGWTIDSVNGVPSGWTIQDITPSYENQYLTFVAETDNVSFTLIGANSSNVFQYSLDNGSTWNNLQIGQTSPSIDTNEKILWKASGLTINQEAGIGTIRPSAAARVEGNIMSLCYSDNFSGQTTIPADFQFRKLFSAATFITSSENMVFPATTITKQAYSQMFQGCTAMTLAPKIIGTSAMTWSGDYCWSDMFHGCTSITTAPILPAATLGTAVYWYMFEDCTNLSNVTCLATSKQSDSTQGWLSNVASSGTFYKNPNMTSWESGASGIPNGWTVQDYNP